MNPFLPSRDEILFSPSLREEIFISLSTTSSSLSGIIFPFSRIITTRSKTGKFIDNIVFVDFTLLNAYS